MTLAVDESTMRKSLEREEKLFSYLDDEKKPSNFRSLSKQPFTTCLHRQRETTLNRSSTFVSHSSATGLDFNRQQPKVLFCDRSEWISFIEYNQGIVGNADRKSFWIQMSAKTRLSRRVRTASSNDCQKHVTVATSTLTLSDTYDLA